MEANQNRPDADRNVSISGNIYRIAIMRLEQRKSSNPTTATELHGGSYTLRCAQTHTDIHRRQDLTYC